MCVCVWCGGGGGGGGSFQVRRLACINTPKLEGLGACPTENVFGGELVLWFSIHVQWASFPGFKLF